jgi:uncharacterized protein YecT (DUF1311 family)
MRITAILIAALLATTSVLAQEAPTSSESQAKKNEPEESCDGSTLQMVECLSRLTETWDKRLNKAYQEALKDAVSKEQREQLRKAQRAWIAYRDANCLYYGMGEGSIAHLDAGTCLRSMTESRALELEGEGHRN